MSIDIHERLARLEQRADHQDQRDIAIDVKFATMDAKLDKLLEALSLGKGVWRAIMKVGAIGVALIAAAAWLIDHLPQIPWLHK